MFFEGGLSGCASFDLNLLVSARSAMVKGLVNYDESVGWRGPVTKIDISGDWGIKLGNVKSLSDISPWRMAVVLEANAQSARIGFQPGRVLGGAISKDRATGIVTMDGVRWAKAASGPPRYKATTKVTQELSPGDVVYVAPLLSKDGKIVEGQYRLRQIPEVSGGMIVMDPN